MSPYTTQHVSVSRWTKREMEILAVTLRLLQQHGYDRLTVEAVATEAKASKATAYRRWPSKADLVLAAFIEGTRIDVVAPHCGSLRMDLLEIGAMMCRQLQEHAGAMRAAMASTSRIPKLTEALSDGLVHQHESMMTQVLAEAADRGEIDVLVVTSDMCDLLTGYLSFRFLVPGRPPTADTVRALVDDVLMPSLTRTRHRSSSE